MLQNAPFGRRGSPPNQAIGGGKEPSGAPRSVDISELLVAPLDAILSQVEAGDSTAMCALGRLYSLGREDVPKDQNLSVQWYLKAEAGGNTLASRMLAQLYAAGLGVPVNHGEAIRRLKPLFKAGDVVAGSLLGQHYAHGWGVRRNVVLAFAYFRIASYVGDPAGLEALGEIAHLLLPQQLDEGEAIAHEWKPGRDLTKFTNCSGSFAETSETFAAIYRPLQEMARRLSPGDLSVLRLGFAQPGNTLATIAGSGLFALYAQFSMLGWVIARRPPEAVEAAMPAARTVETTAAGCRSVAILLKGLGPA